MTAGMRILSTATIVALSALAASCGSESAGGDAGLVDTGDGDTDGGDIGGTDAGEEDAGGGDAGLDDGGDAIQDVPPDGSFVGTIVGIDGGTVVSTDGLLTLEIPPYALTEDVEMAAVRLDDVDDDRFHEGALYSMVPHGLMFDVPVTMRIEYESAPPAGATFGIGRQHGELIEVWPVVRSEGDTVEVLIDGFDDGRSQDKDLGAVDVLGGARDGLIACDSNAPCPRLEMLHDGATVWIRAFNNAVAIEYASNNSLAPPDVADFRALGVNIEGGRRLHRLSGSAAIYWYRYASSYYVSRIAYFGQAGPVAISRLRAVAPAPGEVRLSWAPIPLEVGGEVVVERHSSGSRTTVATLGAGDNSVLDVGLSPETAYHYFVRHVKDDVSGPWSAVLIRPEGQCTLSVSSYGELLDSGAPRVLKNSAVLIEMSDDCLPVGTPRFEWVRYYEAAAQEGGPLSLMREVIRLGQARESDATQEAHHFVEVCLQSTPCQTEDVVAADDIWVYTAEPEYETRVVVSPTQTPTLAQDFMVLVTEVGGSVLGLTEAGDVTAVELEVWTIEGPPTLPVMVHSVTLAAPEATQAIFDFAAGTIPHNDFGYNLRIRVFRDDEVTSIPSPSGVYIQE